MEFDTEDQVLYYLFFPHTLISLLGFCWGIVNFMNFEQRGNIGILGNISRLISTLCFLISRISVVLFSLLHSSLLTCLLAYLPTWGRLSCNALFFLRSIQQKSVLFLSSCVLSFSQSLLSFTSLFLLRFKKRQKMHLPSEPN